VADILRHTPHVYNNFPEGPIVLILAGNLLC
jgi:hypothetical protein